MGLELINILRKKQGLKSEELTKISNVSLGTLNKILNGQTKNPTFEVVSAIARALKCSVDDFDDTKKQPQENLTADEKELIECYKLCSDENKEELLMLARHKALKNTIAADESIFA